MDETKFTIHFENNTFTLTPELNKKIIDLKNDIIKEYMPDGTKYIDLCYMGKNPVRQFGGYTIEPGNLQRGLDNKFLNQFNINNKNLHFSISIDNNYTKKFIQKKKFTGNRNPYIAPYRRQKKVDKIKEYVYDDADFPALG